MAQIEIRKTVTSVEETRHDGGAPPSSPLLTGTIAAVVKNPFAGRYEADLLPFMAELKELGRTLAGKLIDALGNSPARIQSYGKGAIVGVDGELEHGAVWHEPGGWGMREVLGGTKAIVPSSKMVGAVGARLMIPLGHINAAYVRSHFAAADIGVHDAPRPGEIVYALAMATGGRIHARVGGLAHDDVKGEDGLR